MKTALRISLPLAFLCSLSGPVITAQAANAQVAPKSDAPPTDSDKEHFKIRLLPLWRVTEGAATSAQSPRLQTGTLILWRFPKTAPLIKILALSYLWQPLRVRDLTMPPMEMPPVTPPATKTAPSGKAPAMLPKLVLRKGWPSPVSDSETYSYLLFDPIEYRRDKDADVLRWDITGWRGGDRQRFWFKSEGTQALQSNKINQSDLQFLYGRLIAPFYDFQIGLRYDQRWGAVPYNSRAFLVIGLQGMAPGRFQVEPALFISQEGNVSARFTASYDSQITQRLILQPRFEINGAASELKALGYASGLNEVEFGLRLRYEIRREFAPYIGFSWTYTKGSSDSFGRGNSDSGWQFSPVFGVRAWL